ncbi:hypothetical protein RIF29_17891 [Crotalaria pallida]|uniref:Uncharacterized protein n=1 Tax=Crotalaria pallida TaxID=3830 RepID=A0AAN9IGV5_CROPI
MASYENNDMELVEMDLDVFEIDGALLSELLEEQEVKDDNEGNIESLEEGKISPNMMDREQEKQQQNCYFEWLNMMMDMTESINPQNDLIMSWFVDDIVGMVDFGYINGECYSQICDGLVSNEHGRIRVWRYEGNLVRPIAICTTSPQHFLDLECLGATTKKFQNIDLVIVS